MGKTSTGIDKDAAPFTGISIVSCVIGGTDSAAFELLAPCGADKMINEDQFFRQDFVSRWNTNPVSDCLLFAPGLWSIGLSAKLACSASRKISVWNFGCLSVKSPHGVRGC